ncbi:heme-binding protein [Pseudomonas nunensis]|uniref:heme-binding protein n=1 Tax=Pseudomonas nunensis TaxID=2961896 RepID=UPI0025B1B300|nr:heme-binding protein [Pseudomonas nunensis]MDN3221477.1 heme-binding protein [Pseudomonas nunensis]
MQTKAFLSEQEVSHLLSTAKQLAQARNWGVAIAVVDDGGHPLGLLRLDGAAPIAGYIATDKARTAALGRRDSKFYEDMINGGRQAFLSAPNLQGMLEGGVAIWHEGHCVGAVGVSGVKAEQDAEVARLAVEELLRAGGNGVTAP